MKRKRTRKIGDSKCPSLKLALMDYIKSEEEKRINTPYNANFLDDYYDDYSFDDYYKAKYNEGYLNFWDYNNDDNDDDDDHVCSGNDDDFDYDYYLAHSYDKKNIYYYTDVSDPESVLIYNCLADFVEYCTDENIFMDNATANYLLYNDNVHCCLSTFDKEKSGNLILVAESSYSTLKFYQTDDDDITKI